MSDSFCYEVWFVLQCSRSYTTQISGMLMRSLWILKYTLLFTISTLKLEKEDYFTLTGSLWTGVIFMLRHFNFISFYGSIPKSAHRNWAKQHLDWVRMRIRKQRLDEQLSLEYDIFYCFWPEGFTCNKPMVLDRRDFWTSSSNEQQYRMNMEMVESSWQ